MYANARRAISHSLSHSDHSSTPLYESYSLLLPRKPIHNGDLIKFLPIKSDHYKETF